VGAGIVTLREGFEAALVVVIVLAFLNRTGKKVDVRPVWIGAGAAVALTVVTALGLVVVGAVALSRHQHGAAAALADHTDGATDAQDTTTRTSGSAAPGPLRRP